MAFIAAWDLGHRVLWQVGNGDCLRVKVTEAPNQRENSLSAVCEPGGISAVGTQFPNICRRWLASTCAGYRLARDRGAAPLVAPENPSAGIEVLSGRLAAKIAFPVVCFVGIAPPAHAWLRYVQIWIHLISK